MVNSLKDDKDYLLKEYIDKLNLPFSKQVYWSAIDSIVFVDDSDNPLCVQYNALLFKTLNDFKELSVELEEHAFYISSYQCSNKELHPYVNADHDFEITLEGVFHGWFIYFKQFKVVEMHRKNYLFI